jgi:hypothetical protein
MIISVVTEPELGAIIPPNEERSITVSVTSCFF